MFNKAIVAAILGLLAPLGITGDMTIEVFLSGLVMMVINFVGVYFTKNKQ